MNYNDFLQSKIITAPESGFVLNADEVSKALKPHQRDAVIVDRLINRYSNPGDLVLDPFGGLGPVALEAIKAGRRGYTIELNNDYFRDAVGYLKEFEDNDTDAVTMFDLLGVSV